MQSVVDSEPLVFLQFSKLFVLLVAVMFRFVSITQVITQEGWFLHTSPNIMPDNHDLLAEPCQKLRSFGINRPSVGSLHYAAGILSLFTLPGSLKTCHPIKRSGAISICHSVTSLNKAGGVAQAVPVTDGSTVSTGTTTTLHRLICGEGPSTVVILGHATVLADYELTKTSQNIGLRRSSRN